VPQRFTIDFNATNPLFLRRPIPAALLFLLLPQIKRDVTRKTFLAEKRNERRSVRATRALPQAQEIYLGSVFYTKTWIFRVTIAPKSYLLKVYLVYILVVQSKAFKLMHHELLNLRQFCLGLSSTLA